ncbi:hypothetical protein CHARACLAT_023241 [Characodon lateralis]|uniref:Uncharacterized protein n=1 Tax=Characodon lateralis TaxID=208331 RepID=A0ABU7DTI1_9TELE|nr:hypothetical protein [Characodon lateralis]
MSRFWIQGGNSSSAPGPDKTGANILPQDDLQPGSSCCSAESLRSVGLRYRMVRTTGQEIQPGSLRGDTKGPDQVTIATSITSGTFTWPAHLYLLSPVLLLLWSKNPVSLAPVLLLLWSKNPVSLAPVLLLLWSKNPVSSAPVLLLTDSVTNLAVCSEQLGHMTPRRLIVVERSLLRLGGR